MNDLLKNLPSFTVTVTSGLLFTRNSLGQQGVVRMGVKNGKLSEIQPVSPSYLKGQLSLISGNQKIEIEKTLRILPEDFRYFNPYGTYQGAILVREPKTDTLQVKMENGKVRKVKYAFPWLVLVIHGNNLDMAFAFGKPTEKTTLYHPCLPNFGGGTRACLGSVKLPRMDLSLDQYRKEAWKTVIGCVYTNHSNEKVWKEMCTEKIISGYSKISPDSKPVGTFRSFANGLIGKSRIDLFR